MTHLINAGLPTRGSVSMRACAAPLQRCTERSVCNNAEPQLCISEDSSMPSAGTMHKKLTSCKQRTALSIHSVPCMWSTVRNGVAVDNHRLYRMQGMFTMTGKVVSGTHPHLLILHPPPVLRICLKNLGRSGVGTGWQPAIAVRWCGFLYQS